MTSTIALPHRTLLNRIQTALEPDLRFNALLAGGSLLHGGFDRYSDLDLVLVAGDAYYRDVMAARRDIAEGFGELLAAFTGEHVGEPRLLICLYGPDVIHVDLKFVVAGGLTHMVERPRILFDRDGSMGALLDKAQVRWPDRDLDWFEERFWIWVHYAATKIGRGELYEAIGMLAFIRDQVLGPLVSLRAGEPQCGVRRIEQKFPDEAKRMTATLSGHDRQGVLDALNAAMALYVELTSDLTPPATPLRRGVRAYVEALS